MGSSDEPMRKKILRKRRHHLLLECAYRGQAPSKNRQEGQEEKVRKSIK
jgi:hypothetical protein